MKRISNAGAQVVSPYSLTENALFVGLSSLQVNPLDDNDNERLLSRRYKNKMIKSQYIDTLSRAGLAYRGIHETAVSLALIGNG